MPVMSEPRWYLPLAPSGSGMASGRMSRNDPASAEPKPSEPVGP
ncbi:Uncharacterised protein [Mycobacteroides abscessus subsp. abscessus]|nr:Uncharacterised protein [Mycobacteroides abscessus subsp. abscessus]